MAALNKGITLNIIETIPDSERMGLIDAVARDSAQYLGLNLEVNTSLK